MTTRRLFLATALAAALAAAAPANGTAGSEAAQQFVRTLGDRAIAALTGKNLALNERQERFRGLFRDTFDGEGIARFALGRYWRQASEVQRAEYLRLFEDHIVLAYAQRFSEYAGEAFAVAHARDGADQTAIVLSELVQRGGPPVRIEWHLTPADGGYKIFDVVVEGVSMSQTKRSEFASVIQQGGGNLDTFFAALRKQTIRLKANS